MVPSLTDGVIVLNAYTDDDVAAHLAGEDDETARRFGWWPRASTEASVRDAFARWRHEWETGGQTRTFAAREAGTGRLVGGCELRLRAGGPAHVSYWTAAADRRRGYATRALVLLMRYARGIGVTWLEAHVAEDNLASRRVSEKAGFRRAGTFTGDDGIVMIKYQVSLCDGHARHVTGMARAPFEDDGLVTRRLQVAIDCADPDRLATFWAAVLGYAVAAPPGDYATWQDFSRSAGGADESWSAVADPAGAGPRVLFHRVPEPKVVKNRVHLDVRVSAAGEVPPETRRRQVAGEVERLQAIGGTYLRTEEDEYDYFAVMADPEGNEFCIN